MAEAASSHDQFWLLGVARHLIGNRYRSHERRGRLIERIASQRSENTSEKTDTYVEVSAVEAAIEQLNDREREAILLVAWDGLTPADAALVVGCSGSTFRMRLSRGRRRLRVLLRNPEIHVTIERD